MLGMKIYTRGGDSGETSLLGPGRVSKDDPRIEAYGTVDELNSVIGLARTFVTLPDLDRELRSIQADLFQLGAWLASQPDRRSGSLSGGFKTVDPVRVELLEQWIDSMEADLEPLTAFILPGGSPAASALHLGRTVCRRAERRVIALRQTDENDRLTIRYLNRLSDALFVAARWANRKADQPDVLWKSESK
jgi:cob(I)alamin adenosyltransferase